MRDADGAGIAAGFFVFILYSQKEPFGKPSLLSEVCWCCVPKQRACGVELPLPAYWRAVVGGAPV